MLRLLLEVVGFPANQEPIATPSGETLNRGEMLQTSSSCQPSTGLSMRLPSGHHRKSPGGSAERP